MRCLERMLRRARVPMALTQGFNPRPKMTFALALGLGIAAHREVVDLELSEPMEPFQLLAGCPRSPRRVSSGSMRTRHAPRCGPAAASLGRVPGSRYTTTGADGARAALEEFLAAETWPVVRRRKDREQPFDLRPHVVAAELSDDGMLRFRLAVSNDGSARPEDVLEAIRLRDLLDDGAFVTRTDVDFDA